ncbi:MAG: eL32 family ribosomal protein [Nanoarchaeota archaeon]|nr:eL32 family ribosomal protein [Nanoarchaeota archaeon]
MKRQFLRADTFRYKRIGSHSRKLLKWRRPRGKQNKLRLKRTGHPQQPSIGFGTSRSQSGKIRNLVPMNINNLKDLEKASKDNILIISRRIGAKKKLEIIKIAEEKKIQVFNIGGKK